MLDSQHLPLTSSTPSMIDVKEDQLLREFSFPLDPGFPLAKSHYALVPPGNMCIYNCIYIIYIYMFIYIYTYIITYDLVTSYKTYTICRFILHITYFFC